MKIRYTLFTPAVLCLSILGLAAIAPASARAAEAAAPVIILKLDDLTQQGANKANGVAVSPRFIQLIEILQKYNAKASLGIIGNSLETGTPAYFDWIKDLNRKGTIEFWNHGYTHKECPPENGKRKAEFVGASLEEQKESLTKTQKLAKEKLGFELKVLGTPFNVMDENTEKAVAASPEITAWFFGPGKPKTRQTAQSLERTVNLENPTMSPNSASLISEYEARGKSKKYLVLQGHPNGWSPERFAEFEKALVFLKGKGCVFMTPSEYCKSPRATAPASAATTPAAAPAVAPALPGTNVLGPLPVFPGISVVTVTGRSYATALHASVPEKLKNPWDIQTGAKILEPVADGDTLVVAFDLRAVTGSACVVVKLQDAAFKPLLRTDAVCGEEWKSFVFTATNRGDAGASDLSLALFFGTQKQEAEIGGVRVLHFAKGAKIDPLLLGGNRQTAAAVPPAAGKGRVTAAVASPAPVTIMAAAPTPAGAATTEMPPAYREWGNTLAFPDPASPVSMRGMNAGDIDKNGFVFIRDGHFFTQAGRFRFAGVNLTFASVFPSHEEAERLATHLAGIGINAVRLHHIDNRHIWGRYQETQEKFDEVEVDKMDYLVAQLKKNGVYVNLNLHVSRNYPSTKNYDYRAVIAGPPAFKYGKGLDNVMPELIEMQKRYALDLLGHVNPYTKLAYKDDPVVAMVEINNENAFYRDLFANGSLDLLPDPFKEVIARQWTAFLVKKYASLEDVKKAWGIAATAAPREPIPGIMPFTRENQWAPEVHSPAMGAITLQGDSIEVVSQTNDRSGFFQTYRKGLSFKNKEAYTVILEIKGKKGAVVGVNAMLDCAPWTVLGLSANLKLAADDWQEYILNFTAKDDAEACGRITLRGFTGGKTFSIRSVKVEKGAYVRSPLSGEKTIAEIGLPELGRLSTFPMAYRKDFGAFIHDLEYAYWKEMVAFVKQRAGVRVPVTGTQLDYSYIDISDLYDYVDRHAYWKHPSFPGRPWDGNNYYVQNVSMLGFAKNTLTTALVPDRVAGKPYTVSEYDHAYPNEYCAESVPFVAVACAMQDYDGFYLFDFGSTSGAISYFDYFNNFAKKHLLPFAAAAFRSGQVAPLANELTLTINRGDMLMLALDGAANPFAHRLSVPFITGGRVALRVTDDKALSPEDEVKSKIPVPDPRWTWNCNEKEPRASFFKLDDPHAKLYMGLAAGAAPVTFSGLELADVKSPGGSFIFSAFNRNGAVGEPGNYIVTLASRNRYTNVEYLDYTGKTPLPPGDNYGLRVMAKATSKNNVEYVECLGGAVTLTLKTPAARAVVHGIDNRGMPAVAVPATLDGNRVRFTADPKYGTIVYVLEVK